MRLNRRSVVFAVIGFAASIVAVAAVWQWAQWQHTTVLLDDDFSLRVSFRQSHPVLAEYERRLTIIKNGKRMRSLRYHHDTGGGHPLQMRYFSDSKRHLVRLTDSIYDQLIDLDLGVIVDNADQGDGFFKVVQVDEVGLPPLRRSVELGRRYEITNSTNRR